MGRSVDSLTQPDTQLDSALLRKISKTPWHQPQHSEKCIGRATYFHCFYIPLMAGPESSGLGTMLCLPCKLDCSVSGTAIKHKTSQRAPLKSLSLNLPEYCSALSAGRAALGGKVGQPAAELPAALRLLLQLYARRSLGAPGGHCAEDKCACSRSPAGRCHEVLMPSGGRPQHAEASTAALYCTTMSAVLVDSCTLQHLVLITQKWQLLHQSNHAFTLSACAEHEIHAQRGCCQSDSLSAGMWLAAATDLQTSKRCWLRLQRSWGFSGRR